MKYPKFWSIFAGIIVVVSILIYFRLPKYPTYRFEKDPSHSSQIRNIQTQVMKVYGVRKVQIGFSQIDRGGERVRILTTALFLNCQTVSTIAYVRMAAKIIEKENPDLSQEGLAFAVIDVRGLGSKANEVTPKYYDPEAIIDLTQHPDEPLEQICN